MIQAYFQTSSSTIIPARVPESDVVELAAMMGLSERELFSIEIPSGASRHSRVRVLVAQDQIAALYASVSDGSNPSATFYWRETTTAALMSLDVWLLPPRPLYMVAGGAGVAIVEAVDARWWWQQTQANNLNDAPQLGRLQSADGRWRIAGPTTAPATIMGDLRTALNATGVPGTFNIGGYSPSAVLSWRLTDHVFTPECSLAMAIDFVAAATGYVLQWNATSLAYELVAVGGDAAILNTWMAANKRAYVGGAEAPADTQAMTEPLATVWYGNAAYQRNMLPNSVTVSYPYRTVEGKTRYNNTATDTTTLMFSSEKEFGWEHAVTTGRARANIGKRVIKEPRPLVASSTPGLTSATPATAINGTAAPSWNYVNLNTAVVGLLQTRASVMAGTTGWGGWAAVPLGSFRCTMLRYTLSRRGGEMVPITITECDREDWLLGPDGSMTNDPKQIAFSKGLTHVRRLWSGATMTDTAPPNTRVFAATILNSTVICGEETTWKWQYEFEEVEPIGTECPMTAAITPFARQGVARNLMEDGNDPVAGFIMPGISQADYSNALIEAVPIANGCIVMMVEHFPAIGDGTTATVPTPQYWFTMPNAVRVVCTEGPSPGGGVTTDEVRRITFIES